MRLREGRESEPSINFEIHLDCNRCSDGFAVADAGLELPRLDSPDCGLVIISLHGVQIVIHAEPDASAVVVEDEGQQDGDG